ncbi:MAG TPA: hypothetical protein VGI39_45455, partial [Polyangiaceae bacterium]
MRALFQRKLAVRADALAHGFALLVGAGVAFASGHVALPAGWGQFEPSFGHGAANDDFTAPQN